LRNNPYTIGSTPVLREQCLNLRNNAEQAEGALLLGLWGVLALTYRHKNKTDDSSSVLHCDRAERETTLFVPGEEFLPIKAE
jgi:hypothetical protein